MKRPTSSKSKETALLQLIKNTFDAGQLECMCRTLDLSGKITNRLLEALQAQLKVIDQRYTKSAALIERVEKDIKSVEFGMKRLAVISHRESGSK